MIVPLATTVIIRQRPTPATAVTQTIMRRRPARTTALSSFPRIVRPATRKSLGRHLRLTTTRYIRSWEHTLRYQMIATRVTMAIIRTRRTRATAATQPITIRRSARTTAPSSFPRIVQPATRKPLGHLPRLTTMRCIPSQELTH